MRSIFNLISISILVTLALVACKKKSVNVDSSNPIIDCNFAPSQSNFGYSYFWVGKQYTQPSYSKDNIVCNYLNTETNENELLLINKDNSIRLLTSAKASGKFTFFNNKIIFRDALTGYVNYYDIETDQTKVLEAGKTFFCSEFSFSPDGSKFAYEAQNQDNIKESYIFIRDSNLLKVDSINYFDLALEKWTKISWINDHTLLYVFQNNKLLYGMKQFDLTTRKVETIYEATNTNNKDIIKSITYSVPMDCVFFCDGNGIKKISLQNTIPVNIKSSCDSLEYSSLSTYTSNLLVLEKVTRTKINEMRIDEKHSLYSLNPQTLEEKLIIK
ncbi:MAG: hypothetical protein CFE21_04080 [Bacteroidetes bacterium B1(2017)]|nr:MAG: hypothetical protein CFE21_04080 [Bacteroidetes bacterium B1(2017)]